MTRQRPHRNCTVVKLIGIIVVEQTARCNIRTQRFQDVETYGICSYSLGICYAFEQLLDENFENVRHLKTIGNNI